MSENKSSPVAKFIMIAIIILGVTIISGFAINYVEHISEYTKTVKVDPNNCTQLSFRLAYLCQDMKIKQLEQKVAGLEGNVTK